MLAALKLNATHGSSRTREHKNFPIPVRKEKDIFQQPAINAYRLMKRNPVVKSHIHALLSRLVYRERGNDREQFLIESCPSLQITRY